MGMFFVSLNSDQSPLISLIIFGLFAGFTILRNVIRLKNYPDEAESLLKVSAECAIHV